MTFMYARVTLDERGIEIRLGPFGRPRIYRPLANMTSATPREVEWWRYGLGFRWIPRGWAVVPRGGAAVEVEMKNRRRFVFSASDPLATADRLNRLIAEGMHTWVERADRN